MSSEFFVSVIIPVFNAEAYLKQCLDSVIASGIDDAELLLVDDGSTDGSASICSEYAASYPFVQHLWQENSGPSAARNLGLEKARGKYIAFMDADDYVDSAVFSRHVDFLREHNADVWVSDFRRVADNGCVLDEVFQIEDTSAPITEPKYLETFLSAKDCVWNVWRYIFRRDFLLENGLLFSVGFNIAEDLEFVVKALSLSKTVAFYHEPYYFYRVNYGATLTRKYTAQRVEQLMAMLNSAAAVLKSDIQADLIKAKLAREYILNLSIYFELPKEHKKAALDSIVNTSWIMSESDRWLDKMVKIFVSIFGFKITAFVLYVLKCIKRFHRIRVISNDRPTRKTTGFVN